MNRIPIITLLKEVYGDKRRNGLYKPAYQHPSDVLEYSYAGNLANTKRKVRILKGCLLHDILEDSSYTVEKLYEITNIDEELMNLVKLLSRNIENEDGSSYLDGIINNEDALIIKLADRIANMKDIIRWVKEEGICPESRKIAEKYTIENRILMKAINERYTQYLENLEEQVHPFYYQFNLLRELGVTLKVKLSALKE